MQFKKILSILLSVCLILSLFVACSEDTDTNKATASIKPSATTGSTPAGSPTAAPTKEPTPVPTENPYASYFDVDSIVTRFDETDESVTAMFECEAYVDGNDPFLTVLSIETTSGRCITIPFGDQETYDVAEYPYIAIRYKVGLGNTIGSGSHFYAITTTGGPTGEPGWYHHPEMFDDGDWHLLVMNAAEAFPEALNGATMNALRFPIADELNGYFYVAYMGAFKTEEDITSFDTGYTKSYGDKLVKDEVNSDKDEVEVDAESEFTEVETDFEDGDDTMTLAGSYITGDWYYSAGTNSSAFKAVGDGIVCDLQFDAISSLERLENGKPFTITFDVQNAGNTGTNFAGLVLNYGKECNEVLNFYENNGCIADSAGSIVSKSGIGVFFKEGSKVMIYVVTHNAETNKIGYISTEVDTGIDFSSQFVTFKAHDNGQGKIDLYANDTLIASVTYANDGLLPAAATTYNERYYRKAEILDASGAVAASTDSALISFTKAYAFGARAHSIYLDNITVENK